MWTLLLNVSISLMLVSAGVFFNPSLALQVVRFKYTYNTTQKTVWALESTLSYKKKKKKKHQPTAGAQELELEMDKRVRNQDRYLGYFLQS